jgi:hypothetical protein
MNLYMRRLLILAIIALSILPSSNDAVKASDENEEYKSLPYVELPKDVLTILKKGLWGSIPDKELNKEHLGTCVKQKTPIYIEVFCENFNWPYYFGLLEGDPKHIYFIPEGASVENRYLYKITDGKITLVEDTLRKILTLEKIAELLNKNFPEKKFTIEKLEMSAQSSYHTRLPKKKGEDIVILSGDQGYEYPEYSFKPIAKARWNGKTFELIE